MRLAAEILRAGSPVGAVLALEQTGGVGRLGRAWHSPPGGSLSVTFLMREHRDWAAPQFVGMAVALAAASALGCRVAWPNDLMLGGKKVGGVLTQIVDGVPLVGVGANLNMERFPDEIAGRATSLSLVYGGEYEPKAVAEGIVAAMREVPEPDAWSSLASLWAARDATPGKRYRLPSGEEAVALTVGADGCLVCEAAGETRSVMAADALFG